MGEPSSSLEVLGRGKTRERSFEMNQMKREIVVHVTDLYSGRCFSAISLLLSRGIVLCIELAQSEICEAGEESKTTRAETLLYLQVSLLAIEKSLRSHHANDPLFVRLNNSISPLCNALTLLESENES